MPLSAVLAREYFGGRTTEPVSSSDLRLDRTWGQPPETAPITLESSRSMVWVTVSLTAAPAGSISMVQRDQPSAFSSGLNSLRQRMQRRLEGSNAVISHVSVTRPSGLTSFQEPPAFHSASR